MTNFRSTWLFNLRGDVLAGITVALALIPEAIAFSIIADVDPMVGLYASFCIAVTIAFTGGRPGMISAATGAMALVMVTLVADHGLEYLLAATILTGFLQFIAGVLKLGRFITFVPHPVMLGFVNALAILIFQAQLPQFEGATWLMYALVGLTLVIIYGLPRLTRALPSALMGIVLVTALVFTTGWELKTVGDMGTITRTLPMFALPQVPFNLETLRIIFPYALTLAMVGMLESLLTAQLLDEMTDTRSDKNQEIRGQGIANAIAGCFGGMAGCAMIGQSVINVKSGGRGRLSALVAGIFLMVLILAFGDVVMRIPMAALVGVMIMVSVGTFNWNSLLQMRRVPVGDSVVMLSTVATVVYTHDLAKGVALGVALSAIIFGWRIARLKVVSELSEGTKNYRVSGQFFFATCTAFTESLTPLDDPDTVILDFGDSHIWDLSAVNAIARQREKYESLGKTLRVVGLNPESQKLVDRVGLGAPAGH
ncbi:sodium-independent anion transporter [Lujinxingia litoralis]|uniref:Sodium-independent anion transporter n=1 Tax=Lujinxingia litoralis TaxID=2211119 RepID=A0A328C7E4_9DELT|nr:sodium-independent anion transporter [Lujinxingia litoralis]